MNKMFINILEITGGMVKHSEDGLISIDRFPSTPKVGQEWLLETQQFRIENLILVKDIQDDKRLLVASLILIIRLEW